MVTLNKIYTRSGDKGTTALATGERVPKHALRIESYGTVDETNSVIGMARLHTTALPKLDAMLGRIQNELFDLGADLATPAKDETLGYEPLRILDSQVTRLEAEIDEMNEALSPLNSFILPGGTPAAAHLHLARTVCRRAERLVTANLRFVISYVKKYQGRGLGLAELVCIGNEGLLKATLAQEIPGELHKGTSIFH